MVKKSRKRKYQSSKRSVPVLSALSHGELSYKFSASLQADLKSHFKDILKRAGTPEPEPTNELINEAVSLAMLTCEGTIRTYLRLASEDLTALIVCQALDTTLLLNEDFSEPDFGKQYLDEHMKRWKEFVIGDRKRGRPVGPIDRRTDFALLKKVIAEVSRQKTENPRGRVTRARIAKELRLKDPTLREIHERTIEKLLLRTGFKTWEKFLKALP